MKVFLKIDRKRKIPWFYLTQQSIARKIWPSATAPLMVGTWTAGTVQGVLPSKLQIITGQGCGHAFLATLWESNWNLHTHTHTQKKAQNGVCLSPCRQDLAPSDSPRSLFPRRSGWGWVSGLCPFARWLPLLAGSWKATPWREVHTRLFCWQTLLKGCWCDMLLVSPH